MTTTIEDWRGQIDEIDRELLRLLNRRALIALEVGRLKRRDDVPVCDPQREAGLLARLCRLNTGPLDEAAVVTIFRDIIHESRRVQSALPEGAAADPSEQARLRQRGRRGESSSGGRNRASRQRSQATAEGVRRGAA